MSGEEPVSTSRVIDARRSSSSLFLSLSQQQDVATVAFQHFQQFLDCPRETIPSAMDTPRAREMKLQQDAAKAAKAAGVAKAPAAASAKPSSGGMFVSGFLRARLIAAKLGLVCVHSKQMTGDMRKDVEVLNACLNERKSADAVALGML